MKLYQTFNLALILILGFSCTCISKTPQWQLLTNKTQLIPTSVDWTIKDIYSNIPWRDGNWTTNYLVKFSTDGGLYNSLLFDTGMDISIYASTGNFAGGVGYRGGNVSIAGGVGGEADTDGNGGDVTISGGATNDATGGNIYIQAGIGNTSNGDISLLNGNVGIGTSVPAQKLDVKGNLALVSANTTAGVLVPEPTTNDRILEFQNSSSLTTGGFAFKATDAGFNSVNLKINNNGNIGIGTTVPTVKLDIEGNSIRIRNPQYIRSSGLDGSTGTICWSLDTNDSKYYLYVATGTNGWARVELTGNWHYGAACPYVYIEDKMQGTILYKCERFIGESLLKLKTISNKIEIREVEPERSFIEWVQLEKHIQMGNAVRVEVIERKNFSRFLITNYLQLNQNDIVTLPFKSFTLNPDDELYLRCKGFYERIE